MKRILICLVALVPLVASAVWFPYSLVSSKRPPPITGIDHIEQSFETQGGGLKCYDNNEAWTENNDGTQVITNTSFVGAGARGLTIRKDGGTDPYTTSPIITPALANSYWYFTYATTITNAQHKIADCLFSGALRASIWVRATGRISLYEETDLFFNCSPAAGIPTNTLIHVWVNYNLPQGDYELAFATTDTKPTAGPTWTNFLTGGAVALTINQIELKSTAVNVTNYFDKIRGTNIVIGSSPP